MELVLIRLCIEIETDVCDEIVCGFDGSNALARANLTDKCRPCFTQQAGCDSSFCGGLELGEIDFILESFRSACTRALFARC